MAVWYVSAGMAGTGIEPVWPVLTDIEADTGWRLPVWHVPAIPAGTVREFCLCWYAHMPSCLYVRHICLCGRTSDITPKKYVMSTKFSYRTCMHHITTH